MIEFFDQFFNMINISHDSESSHIHSEPENTSAVVVAVVSAASSAVASVGDNSHLFDEIRKIPLKPSADGQNFEDLKNLILTVNEHAGSRGYVVTLGRTKANKDKITRKAWLVCDRGRKIREPRGQNRRHTASRLNECPFSVVAKRENTRHRQGGGGDEAEVGLGDEAGDGDVVKKITEMVRKQENNQA